MRIHYNVDSLPVFTKTVLTIGTFDGVHTGHKLIIETLVAESKKIEGESVIITFDPHPRKVVSSAILGVRLITTMDEKISLLSRMGVDHLVIVPFTEIFANQPAEDYIEHFLVDKFHPSVIIIGYDHRFGRDRLGNYHLLEKHKKKFGYELIEIPKHVLNSISISSTNIREAILHNDIDTANKLLGYMFFFSGTVVHGDKIGRTLGYPTANLHIAEPDKIVPGNGIYAVYATLEQHTGGFEHANPLSVTHPLKGMMSIGFRPTVDGKKRIVEVNLFDFDEEIYSQKLRVYVKKYLREEIKFNSLDELIKAIDQDKVNSLAVL